MGDTGVTLPHAEPPLPVGMNSVPNDEVDRLPIERRIPFYSELYPRDPDEYEPLYHFLQRQEESERYLKKPCGGFSAVRKTIHAGTLRDNGDGCGCFVLDWHGVSYYVVVGFHKPKRYRIAVTAWPMLRDRRRALQSGKWLPNELDEIEKFNDEHFENQ